jgi:ATP-dependent DNA helicase RecQ
LRPGSLAEILAISGFGERKTAMYGPPILEALRRFETGARTSLIREPKVTPAEETKRLLAEGRTFDEIAKLRGRQLASVVDLISGLVEKGELELQPGWIEPGKIAQIEAACARLGFERLKALKEVLSPEISFEEIRLVVAGLRRRNKGRG